MTIDKPLKECFRIGLGIVISREITNANKKDANIASKSNMLGIESPTNGETQI